MGRQVVLYDANVLFPATIRDLLMWLALTDLYQARWSQDIHEEWIESLLRERSDLTREQLDRVRALMDENVRDALVEGYRDLIPRLTLPDPGDRHVLAAAIRGGADVIVTFNVRDFPIDVLGEHGVQALHPDAFVGQLIEIDAGVVVEAVRRQRGNLQHPPVSPERFVARLEELGLERTAAFLGDHIDSI